MKRFLRPVAGILIVIALVFLLSRLELTRYVGLAGMKNLMSRVSPYEPLVFVAFCIAAMFLRFPVIFVVALGGAFFGVLPGLLYGWIGTVLGAFGTFLLARYALKDFFQQQVAERFSWLKNLDARLASNGLQTILLLRFFLFMTPPTNWLIGVSRIQFRDYAIGTMIGPLPLMVLLNYWGSRVATADSLWVLAQPEILLPGLAILILIGGGGWLARYALLQRSNE